MRSPISPRLAAALIAILLGAAPFAAADPTTETQPTPPNFSNGGKQPVAAPAPPTPPAVNTPPVQVGTPLANPADDRGFAFEQRRIKHTVPLDPAAGVQGRWDLLYALGEGSDRKAVYFDWDDDYLYVAAESAAPSEAQFDIDGKGDGWFRGVDNLRIAVTPSAQEGGVPQVTVQRWDTVQNKDKPVWAASPIPVNALKVVSGRTANGSFATLLALPRTETIGLARKSGSEFGLRVEFGLTSANPDGAALYTPRPLLHLRLQDAIDARGSGLTVQVKAEPGRIVPGEGIRAALEVKNDGVAPVKVARLFLRGSQTTQPLLDAATFTGMTIKPGEKVRRSFYSVVSGLAGLGAMVLTGGAETEGGAALAALASFDRVEPYGVSLSLDPRPVITGAGEQRTALVTAHGQGHRRIKGAVTMDLPAGWTVDKGDLRRELVLSFDGEARPVYFKVQVPSAAVPGVYPIHATLQIAGKTYSAEGSVVVAARAATP